MYSDNMYVPYFHNGRKIRVPLPLFQGVEDRGVSGSTSRRGRSVPGLPQRQENTGSAAVVSRGGGPGCLGKHLPQGSAGSGTSATAGKYGFRCRCGKERRTGVPQRAGNRSGRKGRRSGTIWNGGTSCSIPETFHTETSAARIFIRNTAAATTAVTISTDSGPEVSTGQGVRVSAAG